MPGAMHRMGVYLGLVEDEDYDGADNAEYYGHAERVPAARDEYSEPRYTRDGRAGPARENGRDHTRERSAEWERYEELAQPAAQADEHGLQNYQITALHPRTYNEARTIGEQFRKNTPVIMNLSDMEDADAKRLVDFAAGLTFGLRGRIERVTAKVFLLSPHNIAVTAQDKARIENGFFNQS
jgi:cell division inhibitor SepF